MNLQEYAKENKYNPLTVSNHPNNGDIVELLGSGIASPIKTIKAKWIISDSNEHSYVWIGHNHERGIPTITPEYWK